MAIAAAPGGENPSAAFLAGQQHGTQLAVQHHVAAATKPGIPDLSPTQNNAAPVRKPAATNTQTASGVPTLNDILAQARAMASQDTSAQVNAIKQQQDLYNTQASDRAAQINLASQAAAKFLAGIGDNTASSYNTAAQTLAGLAQGYSGDLRNTATDAASQAQAQLASLGAPAGSLKTATGQTSQPEALANVLHGLGGAIPANLLVTSGQAQAAAQRQLPASTLGYGQQQALGTIAAGQQQADQLTPQIVAAQGGQSKLAQQYLASLNSQITNSALANSLIQNRDTTAGVAQQNADTNATRAANAVTTANTRAAATVKAAQIRAAAGKAPKPLTASGVARLNDYAHTLYNGVPAKKQFDTQTQAWMDVPGTGQPPVHWSVAVSQLVARGASPKQAIKILNAQGWQPGEGGRPLSASQKKTNAAVKAGVGVPKTTGPFAGLGG